MKRRSKSFKITLAVFVLLNALVACIPVMSIKGWFVRERAIKDSSVIEVVILSAEEKTDTDYDSTWIVMVRPTDPEFSVKRYERHVSEYAYMRDPDYNGVGAKVNAWLSNNDPDSLILSCERLPFRESLWGFLILAGTLFPSIILMYSIDFTSDGKES